MQFNHLAATPCTTSGLVYSLHFTNQAEDTRLYWWSVPRVGATPVPTLQRWEVSGLRHPLPKPSPSAHQILSPERQESWHVWAYLLLCCLRTPSAFLLHPPVQLSSLLLTQSHVSSLFWWARVFCCCLLVFNLCFLCFGVLTLNIILPNLQKV